MIPPWSTPELWHEANTAVCALLTHYGGRIESAVPLSRRIRARIDGLDGPMSALCRQTCPTCTAPCCARATVWYDFNDLVYLHLCGEAIPVAQITTSRQGGCTYLTSSGCALPRTQRPFVCTWYICPQQSDLMRRQPKSDQHQVTVELEGIKGSRRKLERRLMAAVAAGGPGAGCPMP